MWVYEDKAEVFEKMHLFAQAITLYEKAYSISGAYIIDTYFNFAFVYDKMDDFDTGLHYVEKALREDKKRNSSFLRAAEFFFSFRKPDKALQYLSKITTSSNGDFREQFNHRLELSHVYFDLRKYRKAKKAALECIKLIETQYDSINNYTSFYSCRAKRLCHMGVLYMAQLDYQKAEEVLLEAIHCLPCKNCLSTGCYEAFFILGKVYAVQGNYIKAKEQYQKALQYNDNYTICRRQLEQLEKQI